LAEYGERFAENGIDVSVLPHLTDQDLKDMGVLLGHRRKMLAAIGQLSSQPAAARAPATGTPTGPAAISTASPIAPVTEAAGERRYLTVMFCDLVDSTGIAARLDAEEWRDLVNAYLDDASAAVTEMGGHVAKKLGDGLMALFGYPLAYENDAERAARAALSIQRALADLNRKNAGAGEPELVARIGLETGPAVVDAGGEIFGDVPNIAARAKQRPGTRERVEHRREAVASRCVAHAHRATTSGECGRALEKPPQAHARIRRHLFDRADYDLDVDPTFALRARRYGNRVDTMGRAVRVLPRMMPRAART
jgi:class 3 adenylate cyclase